MRVRPFFWFLLLVSCLSVLAFALLYAPHAPAILQVHVAQQHPTSTSLTTLEVNLTDPQGLPIDEAQVVSSAHMTNMDMWANNNEVVAQGHGKYLIRFRLYMAGPWSITLHTQAQGFSSLDSTLPVMVN